MLNEVTAYQGTERDRCEDAFRHQAQVSYGHEGRVPGEERPVKDGHGNAHGAGNDQHMDAGDEPAHDALSTWMSIGISVLLPRLSPR